MDRLGYRAFMAYARDHVVPQIGERLRDGKVPFPMFHGTDQMVLDMSPREREETLSLLRRALAYLAARAPKNLSNLDIIASQRELSFALSKEVPRALTHLDDEGIALCGLGFACRYAVRSQYFGMVGRALHFLVQAQRLASASGLVMKMMPEGECAKALSLVEKFSENPPRPVVVMVENLDDASAFVTEDGCPALEKRGESCLSFVGDGFRYLKPVDLSHATAIEMTPENCYRFVQGYNCLFAPNALV